MAEATITDVTPISPDVRQYVLRLASGTFEGEPGQHTTITKPEGWWPWSKAATRPYTAMNVEGDEILLAIRSYRNGTVSKYMGKRTVGDTIEVDPSLSGNLTLRDASRPVAFVATGTGITPMFGLLRTYLGKMGQDAAFVFGEKTREQLLFKAELKRCEVAYPIDVTFVLSRESWHGREGYVQEHVTDVVDAPTDRDWYVCGVPEMVVATTERLEEAGVDAERVFTEGWEDGAVD